MLQLQPNLQKTEGTAEKVNDALLLHFGKLATPFAVVVAGKMKFTHNADPRSTVFGEITAGNVDGVAGGVGVAHF